MAKKGKKGGKGKKGKKGGGAKTPTLLGGISVDEMTPEQLIENIGQLKEEVSNFDNQKYKISLKYNSSSTEKKRSATFSSWSAIKFILFGKSRGAN